MFGRADASAKYNCGVKTSCCDFSASKQMIKFFSISYLDTSLPITPLPVQAPIQEETAIFARPLLIQSFGYDDLAFGPTLDLFRIHRQFQSQLRHRVRQQFPLCTATILFLKEIPDILAHRLLVLSVLVGRFTIIKFKQSIQNITTYCIMSWTLSCVFFALSLS